MTQKHKVVVFDLDDTLYKEIDFLKSAYHHIASLVSNVNAPEDEVYQLMLNTYLQGGNAFETVVKTYSFHLFTVQWMVETYRNHKPHISLDGDTRDTLDRLKAKGIILGIISDGRLVQQRNKIEALGLKEFIDEENIIINDVEKLYKPDRRSFLYFMKKYGEDYDYWYIGDNTKKDFVAPNSLGWTTVCLLDDGRNIHEQDFGYQMAFMPNHKISKISDVLVFINDD